jgi:hypothetical protein
MEGKSSAKKCKSGVPRLFISSCVRLRTRKCRPGIIHQFLKKTPPLTTINGFFRQKVEVSGQYFDKPGTLDGIAVSVKLLFSAIGAASAPLKTGVGWEPSLFNFRPFRWSAWREAEQLKSLMIS